MTSPELAVSDLDAARYSAALTAWAHDCKARMKARWASIDFDANVWPIRSKYKTKLEDLNFGPSLGAFAGNDPAYGMALKCLMSEAALKGDVKDPSNQVAGWRLLAKLDIPLNQLRRTHITGLETSLLKQSENSPSSASSVYSDLLILRIQLDLVASKGAMERLAWNIAPQTKTRLLALAKNSRAAFKEAKAKILDRQIEALSDAHSAMFRNDARLSPYDRVALAVMGIDMCCPNRVNEPLCLALDDRFTLEDYLTRDDESGRGSDDPSLTRVHQMLLVKGSKGAAWGAKPILNFMIDFANLCIEVIKQHGERSRQIVSWYERHPDSLFLPTNLEHLRGADIDRSALQQIIMLGRTVETGERVNSVKRIWKHLHDKGLITRIINPRPLTKHGKPSAVKMIQVVHWSALESVLLAKVKEAMEDLRKVTYSNYYEGRLSNMLMLFDSDLSPYLPSAIKYHTLARRLHQTANAKKPRERNAADWTPEPTLFEKLGLKMVVNGVVQTAYIHTHDPRRWLTTQALGAGLPDVLANKWANRLSIDQLKHYDLASAGAKAQRAAMPRVKELEDMTAGLQKLETLEAKYALRTEAIVVGDAHVSMTSMDDIMRATEDRPVARTSNQIIILYPQKYGVCLFQHHEQPCRSYRCGPCNEGVVVKGHLPTNERIRKDSDLVFRSIVNQLDALLIARQRQLADSPERLDSHILTLVREGLDPQAMAKELIARFHEIKDQLKDRAFANQLADAFALTGYVAQLDDPKNSSGALIKYHNPSCHAAPGHERALEARHGGRAAMTDLMDTFDQAHPQFARTAVGKRDQRELLGPDEDESQEL